MKSFNRNIIFPYCVTFVMVFILLTGLVIFGAIFAVNSSIHSYLILVFTHRDHVALNVGFYYMANAAGRLVGTLLSGICYQYFEIQGCLWVSAAFILASWLFSIQLANSTATRPVKNP